MPKPKVNDPELKRLVRNNRLDLAKMVVAIRTERDLLVGRLEAEKLAHASSVTGLREKLKERDGADEIAKIRKENESLKRMLTKKSERVMGLNDRVMECAEAIEAKSDAVDHLAMASDRLARLVDLLALELHSRGFYSHGDDAYDISGCSPNPQGLRDYVSSPEGEE